MNLVDKKKIYMRNIENVCSFGGNMFCMGFEIFRKYLVIFSLNCGFFYLNKFFLWLKYG